eukprot:TRINITY_DN63908_c0_g1_i1.p1 TRINITY_DN63908_c0_g1~~TRINITY_DN63908_c0_g1_i1.p1  ORF type:complete len:289 (+),score=58.37 TRINITY_DN63908_c0_g1_i1:28-894(+)
MAATKFGRDLEESTPMTEERVTHTEHMAKPTFVQQRPANDWHPMDWIVLQLDAVQNHPLSSWIRDHSMTRWTCAKFEQLCGLPLPQRMGILACSAMMLLLVSGIFSSSPVPQVHSDDPIQHGTILQVRSEGPLYHPDTGEEVGEVFPEQVLMASDMPVTKFGHVLVPLMTGQAVEVSRVRICPDCQMPLKVTHPGFEVDESQPTEEAPESPSWEHRSWNGMRLEVMESGPVFAMDEHGPSWGQEVGEVFAGDFVVAAGPPITEDGHTLVPLTSGAAVDVKMVSEASER